MKVAELFETQRLTEEQLIEGVADGLSLAFGKLKTYFKNLNDAKNTTKELIAADGKKSADQSPVAVETRNLRKATKAMYDSASPKVQAGIDQLFKRTRTPNLDGITLSRNYFKDFVVLSVAYSILSQSRSSLGAKGLDLVIDKVISIALTAITGVPSIDDLRDMADMAKTAIALSNDLASKINGLKTSVAA